MYPVQLLIIVEGRLVCIDSFETVTHLVNWIHEGWSLHDIDVRKPGHIVVSGGRTTLLMQDGYFLP